MTAPETYVEAVAGDLAVVCSRRQCRTVGGSHYRKFVNPGIGGEVVPADLQKVLDEHVATHAPTIEEAARALVAYADQQGVVQVPGLGRDQLADLRAAVERES